MGFMRSGQSGSAGRCYADSQAHRTAFGPVDAGLGKGMGAEESRDNNHV